jgi:hypothetical protein
MYDLMVVAGCYFGQCVHVQCVDAYPCTCCGNVRLCVVSKAQTANVKAEIDDVFYLVIWRQWLEATNPVLLKMATFLLSCVCLQYIHLHSQGGPRISTKFINTVKPVYNSHL